MDWFKSIFQQLMAKPSAMDEHDIEDITAAAEIYIGLAETADTRISFQRAEAQEPREVKMVTESQDVVLTAQRNQEMAYESLSREQSPNPMVDREIAYLDSVPPTVLQRSKAADAISSIPTDLYDGFLSKRIPSIVDEEMKFLDAIDVLKAPVDNDYVTDLVAAQDASAKTYASFTSSLAPSAVDLEMQQLANVSSMMPPPVTQIKEDLIAVQKPMAAVYQSLGSTEKQVSDHEMEFLRAIQDDKISFTDNQPKESVSLNNIPEVDLYKAFVQPNDKSIVDRELDYVTSLKDSRNTFVQGKDQLQSLYSTDDLENRQISQFKAFLRSYVNEVNSRKHPQGLNTNGLNDDERKLVKAVMNLVNGREPAGKRDLFSQVSNSVDIPPIKGKL